MTERSIEIFKRAFSILNNQFTSTYLVSFVILLLLIIMISWQYSKRKSEPVQRSLSRSLFLGYLVFIIYITIIMRSTSEAIRANWIPFWSWYEVIFEQDWIVLEELILNFLLFIPYGFFLNLWKPLSLKRSFLVGFIFSATIEFIQLITCRGLFEWDDMLHNATGCILGWVCAVLVCQQQEHLRQRSKTIKSEAFNLKSIENDFIRLIKSIINSEAMDEAELVLTDSSLKEIYKIALKQDLISIIAAALRKNHIEPPDYYVKAEEWNMYRCVQQQYEEEQIRSMFNQEGVRFVFLKGSVVRNYYPSPDMRTCGDIDILVADVDRAISLLKEKLEYSGVSDYCDHHVSIHSPSNVLVEIHNCLSVEYPLLENPWNYTEKIDNNEYKLKDGMFYLYHIAHMKKHFTYGGCGIRTFIDLWIIKEKMKIKADIGLLKECGLDKFEQAASNLTDYWFGNRTVDADRVTMLMESFIFNGGLYGDTTQSVAISRESYGRFSYLFHRLFLPMKEMKKLFPILDKKPMFLQCILYVLCTIRRWLRLVLDGQGKRATAEFRANAILKEDENISILCRELGISRDLSF